MSCNELLFVGTEKWDDKDKDLWQMQASWDLFWGVAKYLVQTAIGNKSRCYSMSIFALWSYRCKNTSSLVSEEHLETLAFLCIFCYVVVSQCLLPSKGAIGQPLSLHFGRDPEAAVN